MEKEKLLRILNNVKEECKGHLTCEKCYLNSKDGERFNCSIGCNDNSFNWDIKIEYGCITDAQIDAYGKFSDYEKKIIKKAYADNPKGTFPNPRCALY